MTFLHLMQASMETFDSVAEFRMDVNTILARQPVAVGFTELGKDTHRRALEEACLANGYRVTIGAGDTGVAVTKAAIPITAGATKVHGPGDGYGSRYLDWARFRYRGEVLAVGEAHWVRGGSRERVAHRKAMTQASLDFLHEYGRGTDLAFMLGDTNTDDSRKPGSALWASYQVNGITTLYDELGVYPATGPGGGTIDMIASRDADRRVRATGYRVWKLLHSDHRQVSGYYHVREK